MICIIRYIMKFSSNAGDGLLFPAWLMHWVPPTHIDRISISWNVLLRGNYGRPRSMQNARI